MKLARTATASILHEVSNKMEDIVKHKITKTTPLVAKVVPTKILLETCFSPWTPKNTEI